MPYPLAAKRRRGMGAQQFKKAVASNRSLRRLGGPEEIRTLDPHNANVMRSQLRYRPKRITRHIIITFPRPVKDIFTGKQGTPVGFTMMCDTGAGAVEMWKTAVRFPHIPTALLRCLRRFSGLREKKVANRDGLG